MRLSVIKSMIFPFLLGCLVMYLVLRNKREGFQSGANCPSCGTETACPSIDTDLCPPVPDLSKYVLKSSIPPCPALPDLDNYMLKSECPPVPDLSQYVMKSTIPPQQPIIIDTSEDRKAKCGDCPPCPRPRCPEVKCPPPTVCPTPAPCPRAVCPQTTVKCRAQESTPDAVRPFLAPLGMSGFGQS